MIWWIWTAYNPHIVHVFSVNEAWEDTDPMPDVSWLGEGGWSFRGDNMGLGLRG